MNEIVTKALESGLWAALFCILFFYMLKDSRQRENKYMSAIEELGARLKETTDALDICKEIKNDCDESECLSENILSGTHTIMSDVKSIESKANEIKSELESLRSIKERL